ncbi:metabotropic glutamate receptor 1, partial [Helicoverpa armigera]|uniref:metabotropic glutamate receptor 1 n=1 Tax=Helicoverpa armigera TaxID=29058 RepID=UPI003082924C
RLALAGGRRAVVPGGVRFGALFAVHGAPAAAGAPCGPVREHYGIQRVEATLLALQSINADAALLPRLHLGAELRDSCWAPATALRQTIHLLREAIAPPDAPAAPSACSPVSSACRNTSQHKPVDQPPPRMRAEARPADDAPLLAVLGPGASAAAVQVQNLLQLFSIPQSYGQSGMAAFREEAARGGVCVAREEALRAAPARAAVLAVLARLARGPRVAVCWCEGRTARALLAGLAARPALRLRLLASDGWADRRDVVAGLEEAARGALTLRIRSPYLKEFDAHYLALKPHNNSRNPWFKEFWEQKFHCSLSAAAPAGTPRCTGMESLATNYTQEPKLALVVRGVYSLAHALHSMRRAACGERPARGLCAAMLPFNVSRYRQHLARVRFRAPDGGRVAFDDNGDPPPESVAGPHPPPRAPPPPLTPLVFRRLSEYDVMSFERAGAGWRYVR